MADKRIRLPRTRKAWEKLYEQGIHQQVFRPFTRSLEKGIDQANDLLDVIRELANVPFGDPTPLATKYFNRVGESTLDELVGQYRKTLAVDVRSLIKDSPEVSHFMEAKVRENVRLIKTLTFRSRATLQNELLTALYESPFDRNRTKEFLLSKVTRSGFRPNVVKNNFEWPVRRIARDQTTKAIGGFNQIRQMELGIGEYEWVTVGDIRVRPSHQAKDGYLFNWTNPPPDTGHPGQDILCRCSAVAVLTPTQQQNIQDAVTEKIQQGTDLPKGAIRPSSPIPTIPRVQTPRTAPDPDSPFPDDVRHGNAHINPRDITPEQMIAWAKNRLKELEDEFEIKHRRKENTFQRLQSQYKIELAAYNKEVEKFNTFYNNNLFPSQEIREQMINMRKALEKQQKELHKTYARLNEARKARPLSPRMQMELELGDMLRRPASEAIDMPEIIYKVTKKSKKYTKEELVLSEELAKEAVELYRRTVGGWPLGKDGSPITINISSRTTRSFARGSNSVNIEPYNPLKHGSPREWQRIVAHELEHLREDRWHKLFKDRNDLTPGEAFLKLRKEADPRRKAHNREMGYPDDFVDAYMGREYSWRAATEIQTMGIDWLIGPHRYMVNNNKKSPPPHDSLIYDEEYLRFVFKYLLEPFFR